jgi:heme-degrading monooxygenase HmoA
MNGGWWYLTVRRYKGSGPPEEIGRRVREGLLPALRQQVGFQAYFAARFDGGGGVFSVSVFDDRDAMTAANAVGLDWVRANLADLLVGTPEVMTSDVKVHLDAQQPGRDAYVIVRMTDDLGPASGVLPTVQERLVPLTLAQPGFRHLYTGRDEARPDRSITVSVFANRDTATAAHAQVVALMAQHRDVWPNPSRIILAGEVLVSAIA